MDGDSINQTNMMSILYLELSEWCVGCKKSHSEHDSSTIFRKPQPTIENKIDCCMSRIGKREAWQFHIILADLKLCIVRLHLTVKSTIALTSHIDSNESRMAC